jgi:hypothetical protein
MINSGGAPRQGALPLGFDDARRHAGEWGEVSDVALDLVLASGDLPE